MATYCGIPLAVLHESYMKQQEKSQMTRQEAIQAAKCYGANNPEAHIKMLEALGLLKFEEEKKELSAEQIIERELCKAVTAYKSGLPPCVVALEIHNALTEGGYRIVKLGKMTKVENSTHLYDMVVIDISQEQS